MQNDVNDPHWHGSFCDDKLCQEWEGDCDVDSHCAGSLKCGNNNCPDQFNWPVHHDCCYMPGNDNIVFPFYKNWNVGHKTLDGLGQAPAHLKFFLLYSEITVSMHICITIKMSL